MGELPATIRAVLVLLAFLAWMACVVYSTVPAFWLLVHTQTKFWRALPVTPYVVLMPGWMVMWAAMIALTWRFKNLYLYSSPWAWIPAGIVFVLGIYVYMRGGSGFSFKQLGGVPQLYPQSNRQQLITSGIRQRVRHPIYLAHLLEMLGWSIGSGMVVCFGLTAFAVATGAVMIHAEDAELERRFGEEFCAYRATVPALLPRPR